MAEGGEGRGVARNLSERLVKVGSADAQCVTGACLLGLVNLFQQPLATGSGRTRPQNARAGCVRAEGLEISSHKPDAAGPASGGMRMSAEK